MTLSSLLYIIGLFIVLFALGTVLCLMLYKWQYGRFFSSRLWLKICFWIPIFAIFLLVLYVQFWAAAFVVILVGILAIREYLTYARTDFLAGVYALGVIIALAHLELFMTLPPKFHAIDFLLLVGFSSVMSDVCAYFFGNFSGKYKLPTWINDHKSWDGVFGQVLGACLGYVLILPAIQSNPPIASALIIGVASALGDILNSMVKRRIGIKEWGDTIPGHGGALDRFASLSLAIAASYWLIVVAT